MWYKHETNERCENEAAYVLRHKTEYGEMLTCASCARLMEADWRNGELLFRDKPIGRDEAVLESLAELNSKP